MNFIKQLAGKLRHQRRARRLLNELRGWSREDETMAALYQQFMGAGDLVFDLGANIGRRVKIFRKLGARVVAFEPQPSCISLLRQAFGHDDGVVLLAEAVDAEPGTATLRFNHEHDTLATLSPDWIQRTRASSRFGDYAWEQAIHVPTVTLDMAITRFGLPAFIKIDVEGHELRVLQGLSQPVAVVSFEFASEFLESTRACVSRLAQTGDYEFNYSVHESMTMAEQIWQDASGFLEVINNWDADSMLFGDVYARRVAPQPGVSQ